MRLWCVGLGALALCACKPTDAAPDSVARAVWAAAKAGDAEKLRALYASEEEMARLFEPALAARFGAQVRASLGALPKRPPAVQLDEVKVEKEADAPAGNGLRAPTHFARVRIRLRVVDVAGDDEMPLVRIGEKWRALPKEALRFLR